MVAALGAGTAAAQERAWEFVSPEASDGTNVAFAWGMASGDHALYTKHLLGGDIEVAQRTADGWRSQLTEIQGTDVSMEIQGVAPDLSRLVIRERPGLGVGDTRYRNSLYLLEGARRHQIAQWIAPYSDSVETGSNTRVDYVGGSRDLRTLILMADPGELRAPESTTRLYRWIDGEITPIDVDFGYPAGCDARPAVPAGTTVTQRSGTGFWGVGVRRVGIGQTGISADARTLVLQPRPCGAERLPAHLYVVRDGQATPISHPVSGDDNWTPEFVGMDEAGDRVFFRSLARVTADDDNDRQDLFMWERDGNRVTRISGAPAITANGSLHVLLAIASPDGRAVWWVMSSADRRGDEIYAWRDGEVRFVRKVASANGIRRTLGSSNTYDSPTQVSYDGTAMVFATNSRMHEGIDSNGNAQVYRLRIDGRLDCVSCLDGRAVGEATLGGDRLFSMEVGHDPRISRDGSTIAFQSTVALLPQDTNGTRDVYLWREDAPLTLISSGVAPDSNSGGLTPTLGYAGMSWDGSTVFFTSWGAFAPGGTDEYLKLYASRVGGGFPSAAETGCTIDCQPQLTPPPALPVPGSETFQGAGDLPDPIELALRPVGRRAKQTLARRGRMTVRAHTTAPARIRVALRARIGARWVRSSVVARRLDRAGTARLQVRLSRRARRHLQRKGALRVQVVVTSSAVHGARRATFVVRSGGRARGKRAARRAAAAAAVVVDRGAGGDVDA